MRLNFFSARRDGKAPPTLKSAIGVGKWLASQLSRFTPEEAVRAVRSLVRVWNRTTIFRFCSCILVLITTEIFRLPVLS
jgi:hypothetical protein